MFQFFNDHHELEGAHAFLSASNYHWVNYDEDHLAEVYINMLAKQKGTELHALASQLIKFKQRLPRSNKTLNRFVNDAIGYRMASEQVLFYSMNCFGTADAILFKNNLLRVHDLKTGVSKTSFLQLDVYTALFCLEYKIEPEKIGIETRIYQNDDVRIEIPEPDLIREIMAKIIVFDKKINEIKNGE